MSVGRKKLGKDLDILVAMAAEIDAYLMSDTLFRQMGAGLPKMTIGGFFLRAHRLNALAGTMLDQVAQQKLGMSIDQVSETISKRQSQFQQKLHQEAEARQRQWNAYLIDVRQDSEARELGSYRTAVEARIILVGLQDQAETNQYKQSFSETFLQKIEEDDQTLRRRWQPRKFIWAEDWESAYPEEKFWWLYGKPEA
ncbi:MAG: hypothetical protein AAF629_30240 [Chloroflexota bacterium]